MANAITPTITGSFGGELVWNMTNYVVADTFREYVESTEIVHKNKFIKKSTGFETQKHIAHSTTGADAMVEIRIMLVGNLPRYLMQQLTQLAKGVLGLGMDLTLRDDWCSDMTYSCRWTNAGDVVENSAVLCGGSMYFQAWDFAAI